MAKPSLCETCIETRDHPVPCLPVHLVHPTHGKPQVFNVRSEALCLTCGTTWRAKRDNTFQIVPL